VTAIASVAGALPVGGHPAEPNPHSTSTAKTMNSETAARGIIEQPAALAERDKASAAAHGKVH
jgi:hypothetical protein